jgi:glyoxylase-like metal-dependent hydrolase (beta-lactamase superfamily II)
MSLFKYCLSVLGALMFASQVHASPAPLQLTVYNPGDDALFPVSSVTVSGEKDAILVDAQFGASQAEQVVRQIRASGKHLTTIYISHGDPDYYFGLETLTKAFPDARVVASAPTVAHIKKTMADKLAYWGPKMGADKPSKLVIPDVLHGNSLKLEGQKFEIIGLDSPQPERSFVWIPSIKAVVGGVVVAENIHVWMADTQGAEAQQQWLQTLQRILNLKPQIVIPGHYLGEGSRSVKAVQFTSDYVSTFLKETPKAKNSSELISAMQRAFPGLGDESSLELSAKVAKGEMQW